MTDAIRAAVKDWNKGESARFDFAIAAASVVGLHNGETVKLAEEIHRSPDVVEQHALTGRMWATLLQRWPSDAEALRESLSFAYWHSTRRIFKDFGAQEAHDWLKRAQESDATVETYRLQLPRKIDGEGFIDSCLRRLKDWQQRVWSLVDAKDSSPEKQQAAHDFIAAIGYAEEAGKRLAEIDSVRVREVVNK